MSTNEYVVHRKTGTRGVVQIDLTDLANDLRGDLTDPSLQFVETDASRPPAATPTVGPHRYTINVPHNDASILNVGTGVPNGTRIKDTGITGRTKSHIHWHTTEGDGKTMVALGGPTLEGWAGFKDVLGSMHGYTMQTEGGAYNDAKQQFYIVSRLGEVVVRAHTENVRVQTDTKSIEIGANLDVAVGAKRTVTILADAGAEMHDNGYKKHFDASYWQFLGTKASKDMMTALDFVTSAHGLYSSFSSLNKLGSDGKRGWKTDSNGKAKFFVDLAKMVSTAARYVHGKEAPGQVKVAGENYASLTGGLAASMFGNLSASMTSVLSASVVGGTAGLKGLLWTSVWAGLGVSIKTIAGKAELKSEKGKGNVSAKEDLSIASTEKKVTITAKTQAQLNATDGPALLHGSKSVYAGAGTGAGYGMGAHDKGLHLGKFNSASDFKNPGFEKNEGFWVTPSGLGGKFKSGKFQCTDNDFTVGAKKIKLDANGNNVTVNGAKVLIG